jgi:hypothetical protein
MPDEPGDLSACVSVTGSKQFEISGNHQATLATLSEPRAFQKMASSSICCSTYR